ncbi:MAG: cytochrome-c peroxidase [Bacteroidia bacterium]|nr:cytochrome-c peroxidase [Bacteroidia bacterium]
MTQIIKYLVLLTVLASVMLSCRDKDVTPGLEEYLNLPEEAFDYQAIAVPGYLDSDLILLQDKTPENNPVTNWGATLGRVLFYDKLLSANQQISCASCHQQQFGFSDTARFSMGHEGGKTGRHSMGLTNARYRVSNLYFWDGRADGLEDQVLRPILDSIEMGMNLSLLEQRVRSQTYYRILFNRAFGDSQVTSKRIALALAQFVRSMNSFESRYDQGRRSHNRKEDFSNFSEQENLGKRLFFDVAKGNCGGCHYSDAFVMDVPRNNGLDAWEFAGDNDIGYQAVTNNALDQGKFIAPSLRNIGIRPPYMHDGRFQTLEQVVRHYSNGIQWSSTLDAHLFGPGNQQAVQFNLSTTEINAIVAFMETLTDTELINDPRFSNPFK